MKQTIHRLWDFLFRPRPNPMVQAAIDAHYAIPFTQKRPVEITENVYGGAIGTVDVDLGSVVAFITHELTVATWTSEKPAQSRFWPPVVKHRGRVEELKAALREALPGAQTMRILCYPDGDVALCSVQAPQDDEGADAAEELTRTAQEQGFYDNPPGPRK